MGHLMSEKAKEIDKTKITLEDQQEKIQTAKKSTKAEIIFAAAKEHGKVFIFRFASHQIL
jgi:hypothetical protein